MVTEISGVAQAAEAVPVEMLMISRIELCSKINFFFINILMKKFIIFLD